MDLASLPLCTGESFICTHPAGVHTEEAPAAAARGARLLLGLGTLCFHLLNYMLTSTQVVFVVTSAYASSTC